MGFTANQNTSNIPIGIGDGTVQVNLRGLLPRETLVHRWKARRGGLAERNGPLTST
jgi:hypothetical protein